MKFFSKKTFNKIIVPFLVTAQVVSLAGTVFMLINKKKTYAGIFAAIGLAATAASVIIKKRRKLEAKLAELEDEEDYFDELSFSDDDYSDADKLFGIDEDDAEEAFSELDDAVSFLENTEN